MPMPPGPAFCVSVHDVSLPTWIDCQRLMHSMPVLNELPLTWLLVPDWHRRGQQQGHGALPSPVQFNEAISAMQAQGHELCLHGYTHLDEQPAGLLDVWRRRALTRSEGEFAALDESAARERLQRGQRWLAAQGWHARGFVPPAWMINAQGIRAVRAAGFDYLGLYRGWCRLSDGKIIAAPTITYSTRHPAGDALWRWCQDLLRMNERRVPVLRLALHPADLRRPGNLAHAQQVIERWLSYRIPLTEYQGYRRLAADRAVVQQEKMKPM